LETGKSFKRSIHYTAKRRNLAEYGNFEIKLDRTKSV
jgi:hypothetical protein